MKTLNLFVATLFILPVAYAAEQGSETATHMHDAHEQPASSAMSEGEIRKIDRETGKVIIKHGPLANLGMPGMAMVFQVQDSALVENLKEGDRIRFVAEKQEGVYTVTRMEKFD